MMPKGDNLKGKGGKLFTSTNQPTNQAKSEGKRTIKNIKEAIQFFGSQIKEKVIINDEEVELTFESNIVYQLYKQANEGNLKAIELISKVIPNFLATPKIEQPPKFIEKNVENFKTFVISKQGITDVEIPK